MAGLWSKAFMLCPALMWTSPGQVSWGNLFNWPAAVSTFLCL